MLYDFLDAFRMLCAENGWLRNSGATLWPGGTTPMIPCTICSSGPAIFEWERRPGCVRCLLFVHVYEVYVVMEYSRESLVLSIGDAT